MVATRGGSSTIDRGDWPQALLCLVFLGVFPPAIWAIWNAPRDTAPLYFVVPFTAVFAMAVPWLIRQVMQARTRKLSLDAGGILSIEQKGLLGSEHKQVRASEVSRIVLQSVDNDGFWHTALLEPASGEPVVFAQGSHEPYVTHSAENMLAALKPYNPALDILRRRLS